MPETTEKNQVQQPRLREALSKARPEMAALEQKDLLQIQVDPVAAVATARGALPQIMAFKSRMERLPEFELRNLENLELYALATTQTQTVFLGASAPPPSIFRSWLPRPRNCVSYCYPMPRRSPAVDSSMAPSLVN